MWLTTQSCCKCSCLSSQSSYYVWIQAWVKASYCVWAVGLACQFVNDASLKQTSSLLLLHLNKAHVSLNDKMKMALLYMILFPTYYHWTSCYEAHLSATTWWSHHTEQSAHPPWKAGLPAEWWSETSASELLSPSRTWNMLMELTHKFVRVFADFRTKLILSSVRDGLISIEF